MSDQQRQLAALQQEVAQLRREVRQQRQRRRPRRSRLLLVGFIALLAALAPLSLFAAGQFSDVDPNSVHANNIIAIRNAGITTGCAPAQNLYCPNNYVRRDEMASFLARTAGIGGNPPVVNALTAVTAANADTATNALNLNGWPANALSRTNAGGNPNVVYLTGSFSSLASVTITVPAPGFVFVTGATSLNVGTSGYSSVVEVALYDTGSGLASLPLFQQLGAIADAAVSPTTVFLAPTPGPRTFVLEASIWSGIGNPVAGNAIISALYVPFGPGGAQAAGIDHVTGPGWAPER